MKFEATYYNYIAQENQVLRVEANDSSEAKNIMLATMRFYAGNHYDYDDIESFGEVSEEFYISKEYILGKYKKSKRECSVDFSKQFLEDD